MYIHLLMEVYLRQGLQYEYKKTVIALYKNINTAEKAMEEMLKDNVSYTYHIESKYLNED